MSYQISFSLRLEFKSPKTVLAEMPDADQHFLGFNPKKLKASTFPWRLTSLRRRSRLAVSRAVYRRVPVTTMQRRGYNSRSSQQIISV
jgi:hypothetical protein